MTPEERQMLADLARKFAQTPAAQPDPEAEEFIRHNIGSRPDALYLMTQTVLIQNMAIEHAQQQIRELQQHAPQQQAPAQPAGGSFLGGLTGGAPRQQPAYYPQAPAAPVQGGGSSFLRSAATTAAGVAAGALAFEGIRSLFGGGGLFGHHGFGNVASGFMGGMPGETIVNNFYERPEGEDSDYQEASSEDNSSYDDSSADDASYDDSGDDGGSDDNFV